MTLASSTISNAVFPGRTVFLGRTIARLALLLLAIVLSPAGAKAVGEQNPAVQARSRLAIVIGNSDYASTRIEDLANAKNDAVKLADSLTRLKFDVLLGTNLSADGFEKLFQEADKKVPTASAVLVFYSGHGLQLQGQNYLLPTDTPDPTNLDVVVSRAIKLNDVISRYSNRDRQTFIFLDACRNNPLGSNAPDMANGLAQIEVGENSFIAFATQPGNIAVDGVGDNSPFTTALLDNVEIPGLSISDMMIRVRNETEKSTLGRQVPWDQSNLREQFYFTEQQELDPVALSASLSRILSDPAAKEKLQVELASNDLQTAVLLVGQNLKSLEITAPEGGTTQQQSGGGTQVASLANTESLAGAKQSVVSGIETLIGTPNEPGKDKAAELARNIQTELRRLGCYRQTVDGDWGKGSVKALGDYYRNTGQKVASADPTVDLLSELFLRSGRICKQPVIVKKVVTAASDDSGDSSATGKAGGKKGKKASTRPAAPPPDISGGIGIGGVF
jgi:Caspase domain